MGARSHTAVCVLQNPLTDEDRANLESFCDQQAAEVQRITRMLEESVEGLRTAVKGLGQKR